jgi:small-conductance mechanosensitive channel
MKHCLSTVIRIVIGANIPLRAEAEQRMQICLVAVDLRMKTISDLNEAINDKFNKAGISIAFPQRDIHLATIKPLRVSIEPGEKTAPDSV